MPKNKRVVLRKSRRRRGLSTSKAGKHSYSVRELSSKAHRTIRTFITDIESHTKEIDALKKDSDFWGAEIFGHKTYKVYGSIDQLAKQLSAYKLQEEHPRKALDEIKVIRIEGASGLSEWIKQKDLEVQESIRNRRLKGRKFQQFKREAERKEKAAKKQAQKLRDKIKQLQKKLKAKAKTKVSKAKAKAKKRKKKKS